MDLCDEDGAAFWNSCWNLDDPDTIERERRAMAAGGTLSKQAKGILLYHEFAAATNTAFPTAIPAWRWLLEPG